MGEHVRGVGLHDGTAVALREAMTHPSRARLCTRRPLHIALILLAAHALAGPAGARADEEESAPVVRDTRALESHPSDRSDAHEDEQRRLRKYRRIRRGGWLMAGISVAGLALTTGIIAAAVPCNDGSFSNCGPRLGAYAGTIIWGAPLLAGLIGGTIGVIKVRRFEQRHPQLGSLEVRLAVDRVHLALRF